MVPTTINLCALANPISHILSLVSITNTKCRAITRQLTYEVRLRHWAEVLRRRAESGQTIP